MARILPFEGEIWKHYKSGGLYRIIAVGQQESDNITVVVYKSLQDSQVYTRPAAEFMEGLEEGYRFEKVGNASPTDLQCFLDLYARFRIEVTTLHDHEDRYLCSLPCGSVVEFNGAGKFICQCS